MEEICKMLMVAVTFENIEEREEGRFYRGFIQLNYYY